MANINITLNNPIKNGTIIKFKAPCDSSETEGLAIKAPSTNGAGNTVKMFTFKDAHGTELVNVNDVFKSGVMLSVILDVDSNSAFIQNADSNNYIDKIKQTVTRIDSEQEDFLQDANEAVNACTEATNKANETLNGIVTIEQNKQNPLQFWVGTQAEYDALETKEPNVFYIISDDDKKAEIDASISGLDEQVNILTSMASETRGLVDTNKEGIESIESELGEFKSATETRLDEIDEELLKVGGLQDFTPVDVSNLIERTVTVEPLETRICAVKSGHAVSINFMTTNYIFSSGADGYRCKTDKPILTLDSSILPKYTVTFSVFAKAVGGEMYTGLYGYISNTGELRITLPNGYESIYVHSLDFSVTYFV